MLVLVELPGVAKENVHLEVADGRLELSAERGKTTYRKEVELPENCSAERMSWDCSNGILQVRFRSGRVCDRQCHARCGCGCRCLV